MSIHQNTKTKRAIIHFRTIIKFPDLIDLSAKKEMFVFVKIVYCLRISLGYINIFHKFLEQLINGKVKICLFVYSFYKLKASSLFSELLVTEFLRAALIKEQPESNWLFLQKLLQYLCFEVRC